MSEKRNGLLLSARGAAMGVAEVIPGVSGGTIAFITGIYEELINTVRGFDLSMISYLQRRDWKGLWEKMNGQFLLYLLGGMMVGMVIGIFFVSYLLDHYPEPLWAFFFGLVMASGIYIARQITAFKLNYVLLFVVAMIFSYGITQLTPSSGSESLLFVFLSGMLAICALILPGISGSFILLLLGMYSVIIPNVKSVLSSPNAKSLLIVGVFALGCLLGLFSFSRILSVAFEKHKNATLAVLTGIMVGSLPKIWPWRNPVSVLDKEAGKIFTPQLETFALEDLENIKVLKEINVLPTDYFSNPNTMVSVFTMIFGFILILGIDKYQRSAGTD